MSKKDHTGEIYGRLTIKAEAPNRGKHRYMHTECSCGTLKETSLTSLLSGTSVSCGCYRNEVSQEREDVIGQTFGQLTIVADDTNKGKGRRVIVECSCGTKKSIFLTVLRSGDAISCGCYHLKLVTTHGQSKNKNPLYYAWVNMRSRCTDPNAKYYPEYGGRGITICSEWQESFEHFQIWAISNGYAQGLTLDRADNSKSYCPDNCRWVNRTAQQRNRRSQKGSSSQFVGVSFVTKHQKWLSSLKINGKSINLGLFTEEQDAAVKRDQYIVDNALQNFTMNGVL